MPQRLRSIRRSLVPLIAVVAGFAFARAAGAQDDTPPRPPTRPVPTAKPTAGPNPYDESEDERRPVAPAAGGTAAPAGGGESDQPGAPPAPIAKSQVLRQNVPMQDGMLRVPGGKFIMLSGLAKNQPPPRAITLAPFWIDRTEVAVGAYRACVAKGGCPRPAKTSASCTFDLGDGDLPISCVHWNDADAFCRAQGKRLPSEIEWEYAARGNAGTVYPWGGAVSCKIAVTLMNERTGKSCGVGHPDRVGVHPAGASVFGVLDMSGNVEEWTADWYVEYLGRGPAPRVGASHVLRGGGWLSAPSMARTTTRNWGSAVEAGPNVGFRCAKDAK
jgi:serine/threonine-protein kinase